jgi:predicted RNA-binding Zn-ribbon protein involved in translation (DUF1610 family)
MSETRRPDELSQFASDLQLMRHRAINLRLYATGERLDWAIRMAGFEIAGDYEGCSSYEAAQAAPRNFQTVLSAQGRVQNTPCPDCGSAEIEMRAYGGSWDDAETHCAKCGKLIQRAWN